MGCCGKADAVFQGEVSSLLSRLGCGTGELTPGEGVLAGTCMET